MQRQASTHIETQGFYSSSQITLKKFIKQLDRELEKQKLIIVNGPGLFRSHATLVEAQKAIKEIDEVAAQYACLNFTTIGLMYLSPDQKNLVDIETIRKYYDVLAEKTLETKKCTCINICAVAFKLGEQLLSNYKGSPISIEICQFINWSHMLMRISRINAEGASESLFYDPWYQRCYTNAPEYPKLISEDELSKEMDELRSKTRMIQPSYKLSEWETQKLITNSNRDYSYYVAWSNDNDMSNPSKLVPDPSRTSYGCQLF